MDLSDRYTDATRRVLGLAREEAAGLGASSVDAAHLLLGLVRHGRGVSALLMRDGLTVDNVRQSIVASGGTGDRPDAAGVLPIGDDALGVLAAAEREAVRRNHPDVATHHLLIAIVESESTDLERVFVEQRVDAAAFRRELRAMLDDLFTDGCRVPPSYQARITPTAHTTRGTESHGTPASWRCRGIDLRRLVSEVFGVEDAAIEWQSRLDPARRYDVEVHLPELDGEQEIHRVIRDGLREQLRLVAGAETSGLDVFSLSAAADGATPGRRLVDEAGGGSLMAITSDVVESLHSDDAIGAMGRHSPASISGSMDLGTLCEQLGPAIGSRVVNYTGLSGVYEIDVHATSDGIDGFVAALRDQAGLVLTRVRRDLPVLVVKDC